MAGKKQYMPETSRDVFNISAARKYLGIGANTMKSILDSGELSYRKAGKRRYLISKDALDEWLLNASVGSGAGDSDFSWEGLLDADEE